MTPPSGVRWQKIEEIYTALEGLPADERERQLLALRPLDLAADVRSLFAAIDAEAAAQSRFAAPKIRQPLPVAPDLLGYQILDPLGSGGAGVVYRASRLIERGSAQPVAMKVFHLHRAGLEDRQRFVRELAIVATLDHPAIVKFFDGGFTSDDRPYLVMELVEGLPLTTYCARHQLTIEGQLRLLLGVIDAIAWAHARLVVHLDLKPSNILVTAHGTPKVLDFGAARLLDYAGNLTVTQQITPQYASPERLRAEPPTVASDIYSLGLLLFEVLSGGGWPFPSRESLVSLAERAAGNSSLTPLSQAVPADSPLRRQLDGDLDAICAKALAFDPAERYSTANDLADDVRRYLDGKPVHAHPPSVLYRTRKFALRYWGRLVGVALVVVSLGGAGGYSAIQAQKARRAAAQAELTIATLSHLLSESNFGRASGGRDMTVKELLTAGVARISPTLSSDPTVSADFAVILAQGFIAQEDFKQARTAVDQALRLAEASGDDTRRAAALVVASSISYHESRPEIAWDQARRAFELWQAHSGAFSNDRSIILGGAGTILLNSKPSNPVAGEAYSACLQIAPPASQYRAGCLEGLANVGIYSRNAYRQGLPMLAEAVAIRRANPPNPVVLASALQAFGLANRFLGQYAEDEAAQREAFGLLTAANGPDALVTANFRAVWASSLAGVGRAEAGLAEAEGALAIYRRHFPQPGANLLWTPLSAAMSNACLTGRFADCEQFAREASQTLGPNPSPKDNRLISAQGHLGWALARLGHAAEARPLLSQAVEAYRRQNRRPPTMSQFESALQSIAGK